MNDANLHRHCLSYKHKIWQHRNNSTEHDQSEGVDVLSSGLPVQSMYPQSSGITVADHLIVQIEISIVRNEKSNLVWRVYLSLPSVCLSLLKNLDDDITDNVICCDVVTLP